MHIEKDVSPIFVSGTTNLTTANTPIQAITRTDVKPLKGVQFKAGVGNTGNIFIGGSNVNGTATSVDCGLELEAGDQIFLPLEDPTVAWFFNATANDIVHWIIM
jgi:hypothetical protein